MGGSYTDRTHRYAAYEVVLTVRVKAFSPGEAVEAVLRDRASGVNLGVAIECLPERDTPPCPACDEALVGYCSDH